MFAQFDIIFAGGGTTACVVAGRLTAAEPSLKILVVESGPHTLDLSSHVQPCRYVEHLAPNSTTVTFHVAKPSPYLNGRAAVVPCGRSVGGGSTVNLMLYVRGAASDYNDWCGLGNEGWSFTELLPLIKKSETFHPIPDNLLHGYSGPIQISRGGADFGFGKQFLQVGSLYDSVRPQVDDINDFKTANAYAPAYKCIEPVTGKRSDTASHYLYPHSDNPNFQIMVGKHVKRVIIQNGRAAGIEYTIGDSGDTATAMANKLIVVSAGAFGSPAILERSGIGASSILEKNNIRVLVDLPGVGGNYQDHLSSCPGFYGSEETETLDDVWSDAKAIAVRLQEWEERGTGKIAHNGIEAMVKVRPTAAQMSTAGPELQLRWQTFFQNSPDKPLGIIFPLSGFLISRRRSISVDRKHFSAVYYSLYPESIGSVHVTSGEDVNSPPDFNPNYCSKPGDVAQLTLLYKMTREIIRRMPAYRGEIVDHHPNFPPGPAVCKELDDPASMDAPDIIYSAADDEAIEKFHRDKVSTTFHSLGTCAMKPRNQNGVVDARLNVYGVDGLKVADLSICPTNVGNNTYSTALLIGEKAAAIIAEELGITLE